MLKHVKQHLMNGQRAGVGGVEGHYCVSVLTFDDDIEKKAGF